MPLCLLVPHLNKTQLQAVSRVHNCCVHHRAPNEVARQTLENHNCQCGRILTVFEVRTAAAKINRDTLRKQVDRAVNVKAKNPQSDALRRVKAKTTVSASKETTQPNATANRDPAFPPAPASKELQLQILKGMSECFLPSNFEEVGCTVCGLLVSKSMATVKEELMVEWDLLCRPAVTRKARSSQNECVTEEEGPVLDKSASHVCVKCEGSLRRHTIPAHALVNHLWIGEVPWQLRELKFAEQMLIAKVRHNRCVMRVASGRGIMMANAIMFQSPIIQVYKKLPLSKDEVAQVLAFVFMGSAKPTEEDFARTPMLLNHPDYYDLDISQDNLAALPEAGIFCGVEWKETKIDDPILESEGLSQHETGEDREGTDRGPCPFVVSATALDHLKAGGKTLGVRHAVDPESTYNNPQLYPQMFPWLFPFGKGGIGHPEHKCRISSEAHIKHLLMYHDKRFQNDFYFPMVAFNESQIKCAKTGSHLLIEKRNIASVTSKLRALDGNVLANLARRLEAGEHIKDKTEAEQACFDILSELEHVGSHVQGSLASKKHFFS
ncbi:hypothetical protein C8R45DRAFT_849867 [Mycena sanguinolenta]|nr:hypothetical protein C8R45DRAFT_849867 [Mycena sanguinolenta]